MEDVVKTNENGGQKKPMFKPVKITLITCGTLLGILVLCCTSIFIVPSFRKTFYEGMEEARLRDEEEARKKSQANLEPTSIPSPTSVYNEPTKAEPNSSPTPTKQRLEMFTASGNRVFYTDKGFDVYIAYSSEMSQKNCMRETSCEQDVVRSIASSQGVEEGQVKETAQKPSNIWLTNFQIKVFSAFSNEVMYEATETARKYDSCLSSAKTSDQIQACNTASSTADKESAARLQKKYATQYGISEAKVKYIEILGTSVINQQVTNWKNQGMKSDEIKLQKKELAKEWSLTYEF